MGMWAVGIPKEKRVDRREWVMLTLPALGNFCQQRAGTLSGGQHQIVSIVRAMPFTAAMTADGRAFYCSGTQAVSGSLEPDSRAAAVDWHVHSACRTKRQGSPENLRPRTGHEGWDDYPGVPA